MYSAYSDVSIICFVAALVLSPVIAFQPAIFSARNVRVESPILSAGGFEWEDPVEAFDEGVENPYKNPDLIKGDESFKIDPARLLSPRLNGANLYFVGMMGSGKSAVGKIVAKRKWTYGS